MTTPLGRRIRHARRLLGYGLLVLLILVALLVGVAKQLLPMVESHPEQIAGWLSKRVGEPVTFSHARAEWTRRGPRFILDDLHVGEGASQLRIGGAQLQVAVYSGLLPGQPLTELKIRELSLTLVREADGRWQVVGLPGQEMAGDPFDRLEGFGELQIEKAQLAIRAPQLQVDMRVPRIDARVRVNGPRLRVGVSAWFDSSDEPVSAVLDLQRRSGNGQVWVGGKNLVLSHWAPLLASAGVVPERGTGEIGLWGTLRDQRIVQITMQAALRQASAHSAKPMLLANGIVQRGRLEFEELNADARWQVTRAGWRIQAPHLNMKRAGKVAHLDGILVEGGTRFALVGKEMDLSPLAALLSVGDQLPDPLRSFLQQANPQAVLRDVSIHGRRDGPLHGSLLVSMLELQAHGQRPGVSGMAGRIEFDERGGVMRLDSSPVHVDWPVGLRQAQDVRLTGSLALWKTEPGWTLGSNLLRVQGADFGANMRLQLGFQGDGSSPTMDLAANLDPTSFATAKKLWILNRMPASTVRWLDTALVEGSVVGGRIAIGGDLDDWPFRDQKGNFDARAQIRDATLKFHKDWPTGEAMNLDLVFNGPGFSLDGSANLLGNRITRVSGGIADFHAPWLKLQVQSLGDAERLRQLMLASPLEKEYGEHLRALTIAGIATVALGLELPLHGGLGERKVAGDLLLAKAALSDSRWDVAFTDVGGKTHFDHGGFATENLGVRFAGQPGVFNLRVGQATGDRKLAAAATLDGRFTASSLVDRYKDLAWLKPTLQGTSAWKISVNVPASAADGRHPASQLRVASDLVGTSINLPAPLRKSTQGSMELELLAPLPIEQGEIGLRLGNVMRLRGQLHKDAPLAASIFFGDGAVPAPPAQGLSVRGRVDQLDSTGWVAFAAGESDSRTTVNDVDVTADQLVFIGRSFAGSRLQLTRVAAATRVVLKGAGIDGTIDIGDKARGVQGRFAKMHVPSEPPKTDGAPATAAAEPDVDDPAKLPPMRFSFADLRIGQAQLGKAELVTSPMTNGLRVEKFRTEAKNLTLSAAGEWVRLAGGGTRSSLLLDFSARSLGQMLDALGYANMVEGGSTKANLAGSWPGSPGAFELATFSGTLKADIGEGRLLDVEPGGSGRVLGLLSLAEIPRRLSLDFSDFFKKGFAFNIAHGDFVFSQGKARTENLRIDGPAAEIRVSGVTGLREQVYDQRVEVLPKAGGLLPALGMLAGGPAGAAVGAVAQAVLQRPLKQTTRVVYRVTGPWQKPVVKVVERGPSKLPTETARNNPAAGAP